MAMENYAAPIFFSPLLVERVWGGNRLGNMFGKTIPPGQVIGESWELTDRPDAQSVACGAHAGRTLRELIAADPAAVLGPGQSGGGRFPLLIKYIDAGAALSVQVHPDDAGAAKYNDLGKNECWVVVHAEPGAQIVRGFKPGTTRASYADAVSAGNVESVLHTFSPRVGDVVALPAGMVHALGAGIVLAEIQQNSDLTFRIYDYNRVGLDGKPRKLHLAEALDAIRFEPPWDGFYGDLRPDTVAPTAREDAGAALIEALLDGPHFDLVRVTVRKGGGFSLPARPSSARVLLAIAGSGRIHGEPLCAGQTLLLPAAMPAIEIAADAAQDLIVLLSQPRR